MSKYEAITAKIPVDSSWQSGDLAKKADGIGITKSVFIITAVDAMMQMDTNECKVLIAKAKIRRATQELEKAEAVSSDTTVQ